LNNYPTFLLIIIIL